MSQPIDCTLITRTTDNTGNYIAGITIGGICGLLIVAVLIGFVVNCWWENRAGFWRGECHKEEARVRDLERQIVALQATGPGAG